MEESEKDKNKRITKQEENNEQKVYSKPKSINNYSKYKWNQFSNQKTVTKGKNQTHCNYICCLQVIHWAFKDIHVENKGIKKFHLNGSQKKQYSKRL